MQPTTVNSFWGQKMTLDKFAAAVAVVVSIVTLGATGAGLATAAGKNHQRLLALESRQGSADADHDAIIAIKSDVAVMKEDTAWIREALGGGRRRK